MATVILVANSKGGVGKTTTAVTVGHALTYLKKKVLLVDLDAQGHVAYMLGLKRVPDVYHMIESGIVRITDTGRKNLYAVIGNEKTAIAANALAGRSFSHSVIRKILREIADQFDYIILDTPPGISPLTVAALVAATHVMIPVSCEVMALDGLTEYTGALADAIEEGARCQLGWVVPTMYDRVRNTTERNLREMHAMFPDHITTPIPREAKMAEAPESRQTIWELAPKSHTAAAYAKLTQRVLEVT